MTRKVKPDKKIAYRKSKCTHKSSKSKNLRLSHLYADTTHMIKAITYNIHMTVRWLQIPSNMVNNTITEQFMPWITVQWQNFSHSLLGKCHFMVDKPVVGYSCVDIQNLCVERYLMFRALAE